MKKSLTAAALLLALLAAPLTPGAARAEVIERVVATINDDAIFLSELRRRAAPMLEGPLSMPTQAQRMEAIEQLYREVLDRMIQEELFLQAADEMQVSVSRAEVDRAIANVQRQSGLDDATFWQAVRGQGFSEAQYRSDVRRQLLRLKVLNFRARGRVNITEEQVRERYEMQVARGRRTAQFEAAQLFFEVPSGATATEVARIRAEAEAARDDIGAADDFWAEGGMRLGVLNQGELPEALEEALLSLDVGEIGEVVRGPAGFHVFLLIDRQQSSADVEPYEEMRMPIYQQMMEQAMAQQEELLLSELRRAAVIDVRL
ncbi:MAG: SurA N-terminal domain-containing protein [Myxococcota bacterium]|nr:SurA N-terminal domain-containing protein [Myxococcota bacterium]